MDDSSIESILATCDRIEASLDKQEADLKDMGDRVDTLIEETEVESA